MSLVARREFNKKKERPRFIPRLFHTFTLGVDKHLDINNGMKSEN
jgi:hypothetical protein